MSDDDTNRYLDTLQDLCKKNKKHSTLENAIKSGNISRTKWLLKKDYSPIWKDTDGASFLKWELFNNINLEELTENQKITNKLLWNTVENSFPETTVINTSYENKYGPLITESVSEWKSKNPYATYANFSNRKDIKDEDFTYFWGLEALNISGCTSIEGKSFMTLKGIHSLDISNCSQLTDDAVTKLSGIYELNMSNCKKITEIAFINLRGIYDLNIEGCTQITDRAFSCLKGIKILDMKYCEQITDNALRYLSGIKIINLEGCPYITDVGLSYLICETIVPGYVRKLSHDDNLKGIKHLNISKINKFTEEMLNKIKRSDCFLYIN